MNEAISQSSVKRYATWVVAFLALAGYAYWQLNRVHQGHLFALALPWDRPPTLAEILDAKLSAQTYLLPAVIVVLTIGCVAAIMQPRLQLSTTKPSRMETGAIALFLVAAMADLLTTLRFFHQVGVNYELHPGIRLFGYAYGLTIGPIAGKAVQAAGVLIFAMFAGRGGIPLMAVVTLVYGAAAIHNYISL